MEFHRNGKKLRQYAAPQNVAVHLHQLSSLSAYFFCFHEYIRRWIDFLLELDIQMHGAKIIATPNLNYCQRSRRLSQTNKVFCFLKIIHLSFLAFHGSFLCFAAENHLNRNQLKSNRTRYSDMLFITVRLKEFTSTLCSTNRNAFISRKSIFPY